MLWEMISGIIQRSWLASGYTLPRQSTELVVGFHTFPREDGLSHAGINLDHGFLAVGHGTVPLACSPQVAPCAFLMVALSVFKDVATNIDAVLSSFPLY